jgi:hypothetical protein
VVAIVTPIGSLIEGSEPRTYIGDRVIEPVPFAEYVLAHAATPIIDLDNHRAKWRIPHWNHRSAAVADLQQLCGTDGLAEVIRFRATQQLKYATTRHVTPCRVWLSGVFARHCRTREGPVLHRRRRRGRRAIVDERLGRGGDAITPTCRRARSSRGPSDHARRGVSTEQRPSSNHARQNPSDDRNTQGRSITSA